MPSLTKPKFDNSPSLETAIAAAQTALLALQHADGYWSFELEADCTIPAEYILMMHYLGEVDGSLQAKLAVYLRARQTDAGGWPLYLDGAFDMSCSVKAYYALKLAGDPPDAAHMTRARTLILARGGAARANVFTRIALALFGQLPWRGVPFMPIEIMLLPRWFPFHLSKISYWSRTVMVPLLILCSLKPQARNPQQTQIRELFTVAPEKERHYFPSRSRLNRVFLALSRFGQGIESLIPGFVRKRAIKQAESWIVERLNGEGGLGAIFPAMVNAYEALVLLDYPASHPARITARLAIDKLLIIEEELAYCQPCVSPVWDTGLACLALQESGDIQTLDAVRPALDWLLTQQLHDQPGDWRDYAPDLPGGGWPFQFENSHYPDLDDTAAVAWAIDQSGDHRYDDCVRRAADWLVGMQSANGGFASFDADNTCYYLNEIPFADHGALLDPPTADVSGRCVALLGRLVHKDEKYRQPLNKCIAYLRKEQEADGSWFGRWGTNYIYGTWSVLAAFDQCGIPSSDSAIQHAAGWLKSVQRKDGGWGESNDSYQDLGKSGQDNTSTAFQTAWALLGLLAAGQAHSPEAARGVDYLLRNQTSDGLWQDAGFTAPGFPRVFYLKYHGYQKYFPLWALARYRKLVADQSA